MHRVTLLGEVDKPNRGHAVLVPVNQTRKASQNKLWGRQERFLHRISLLHKVGLRPEQSFNLAARRPAHAKICRPQLQNKRCERSREKAGRKVCEWRQN